MLSRYHEERRFLGYNTTEPCKIEPWYGFDLDGTIAYYDGWKGPEHIGEPIPSMIEILKNHLKKDHIDKGHQCWGDLSTYKVFEEIS